VYEDRVKLSDMELAKLCKYYEAHVCFLLLCRAGIWFRWNGQICWSTRSSGDSKGISSSFRIFD
jgi:hypothetical protein